MHARCGVAGAAGADADAISLRTFGARAGLAAAAAAWRARWCVDVRCVQRGAS